MGGEGPSHVFSRAVDSARQAAASVQRAARGSRLIRKELLPFATASGDVARAAWSTSNRSTRSRIRFAIAAHALPHAVLTQLGARGACANPGKLDEGWDVARERISRTSSGSELSATQIP